MRNRYVIALAVLAMSSGLAGAQPYGPERGYGMMGYGYGGYGPMHMLLWAVILVAVIAGIVWLVRTMSSRTRDGAVPPRRSPGLDVLEERYARGEINRDEYLQKKGDIAAA